MKTKMIIAVTMLLCIACTNNKPLTDDERQQITTEVKAVSDQIFKAAEKANAEAVKTLYYDIPGNFILMPDGKKMTGAEFIDMIKNIFSTIDSQKIITIAENFNILDRSTVTYTNVSKTLVHFKDSSILEQNPWSSYFLFRKIDDQWRWVGGTESGQQKITRPAALPKDLDQIELSKQWLGKWIYEHGDTVTIIDHQAFGKAQTVSSKITIKGKPYLDIKQLWGYDRLHNSFTYFIAGTKGRSSISSLKFTSPTTFTLINYNDISAPQYATYRIEGEFTDPGTIVEKLINNNETVRTYSYKRIK